MSIAEISQITVRSEWSPTLSLQGDVFGSNTVSPPAFDPTMLNLSASSTPKVLYYAAKKIALVAGALTIDLTALSGWALDDPLDATGLKVIAVRIRQAASGNSALTIAPGAANPYPLFGAGNSVRIEAGDTGWLEKTYPDETLVDVGAAACEIDLSGTAVEESFWDLLLGSQP